ncbi:ergot alkaloid biosynthesis protein [Pseudonocardiaceae bacterium YIM PH 21723]|nr:ergot alkaloid biosynthesis protein [Pseudonocardiaceae bacterium YIM PH 21723]
MSILVTGATGTTGSRLLRHLTGHPVTAASRHGTVRFDWYDPSTFDAVLDGADRAYLVPPIGDPAPAAVMLPFLRLAGERGMRRAVLLSSSAIPAGGPGIGAVHQALPGIFEEWAVLRPSWFMQNFTGEHAHADSIRADGTILSATGSGRVGFVDADDIAAVAAAILTGEGAPNTDLVLTGPQTLSYRDVATILTEETGRLVEHREVTAEQLRARLSTIVPPEFATMLAEMDLAISRGSEDRVTDTVRLITGRPPREFRTFVRLDQPERGLAAG